MVKPTWIPRVPQQIEKFFRNLLPGTNDADDLSIIKEYIDDVGPHVAKSELTGFVITCRRILGGTAERGLIPKVIHVILWRRDKLSLVDLLLAFLVDRRLLVTYYESDYAENFVKGLGEDDQIMDNMDNIVLNVNQFSGSIDLDVLARISAGLLGGSMPFEEDSSESDSGSSSDGLD